MSSLLDRLSSRSLQRLSIVDVFFHVARVAHVVHGELFAERVKSEHVLKWILLLL
ncbi:hypothetical protein T4B_6445 [Trichinella pseudospiralis]|uniref:Uncharacterized protein n=1 Tax=Trichinella pseudospiralis TaxID=6337 RepID=A0A0V1ISM5_TRIPS|nr:hypothetical protein T4B_6445 [Trichinella pseudospiralis]